MLETMGREPVTRERIQAMILDALYGGLGFEDSKALEDPQAVIGALTNLDVSLGDADDKLSCAEAEDFLREVFYTWFSRRTGVPVANLSEALYSWPDEFPHDIHTYWSKELLRSAGSLLASYHVALDRAFDKARRS